MRRPCLHARSATWIIALAATLASACAQAGGDGLVAPRGAFDDQRWQPRIEFDGPGVLSRGLTTHWSLAGTPLTARLLGDYHFEASRLGQSGGLRLTSGVLLNLRGSANLWAIGLPNDTAPAQPYAGIGYSGFGARGDWGFNADLGLTALNPGATLHSTVQLGRVFSGGANLSDAVRDLRLSPVVRLGMYYSF